MALNVVHVWQSLVRYRLLAEHSRRVGSRPVKASVAAGFAGCSLDRPRPPGTLRQQEAMPQNPAHPERGYPGSTRDWEIYASPTANPSEAGDGKEDRLV